MVEFPRVKREGDTFFPQQWKSFKDIRNDNYNTYFF